MPDITDKSADRIYRGPYDRIDPVGDISAFPRPALAIKLGQDAYDRLLRYALKSVSVITADKINIVLHADYAVQDVFATR